MIYLPDATAFQDKLLILSPQLYPKNVEDTPGEPRLIVGKE